MATRFDILWAKLQFDAEARAAMYRSLSAYLRNDVTLNAALTEHQKEASYDGKKPGEPLAIVYGLLLDGQRAGRSLAESLAGFIPEEEYMLLQAGEQAGSLVEMLNRAAFSAEALSKIKTTISGALSKPLLLTSTAVLYLFYYAYEIIPQLALPSLHPESWSPMARSLVILSNFVISWWWLCALGFAALVVCIYLSLSRLRGRIRVFLEYLPPWSIYKVVKGSSVMVGWSSMLGAGIKLDQAIVRVREHASPWLVERLDAVQRGMGEGLGLGRSLRKAGHHFPHDSVIRQVVLLEGLADFEKGLAKMSDGLLEETLRITTALAGRLEFMANILMALLIIYIAMGSLAIGSSIQGAIAGAGITQ